MSRGTLKPTEPHPAALTALAYLQKMPASELMVWQASFASNALEGNRLAEICYETLDRLLNGEPVSDRYLLGLVTTITLRVEDTDEV